MKKYFIVLFSLVLSAACSSNLETREIPAPGSAGAASAAVVPENNQTPAISKDKNKETTTQSINPRGGQTVDAQIKAGCLTNRRGAKVPDPKQTFVMDFEPFRDACFVTFHDAERTNPSLDSEFYVYLDGKQIYEFPKQFNGVSTGCWVEAISFVDLNEDELKDIVVAGMCSAKTAPYGENMVYANTGENFTTDEDANSKLANFKKTKEIENFVRRNQRLFFK